MKQFKSLLYSVLAGIVFSACSSEEILPGEVVNPVSENGFYILSEGAFSGNNATLGFYKYDSKQLVSNIFGSQNNRGLGDVANDAILYGTKMYIAVTGSGTVEVVKAEGATSIKQIDLKGGGVNPQPRYFATYQNKVLVSSYDGTVAVVDTTSLTVDKYIKVGRNPERMAVVGSKLFVANSGGLDFPNYDKTVSVIDLTTFTEVTKIEVGLNPVSVFADALGDVYVYTTGDYATEFSALYTIDAATNKVKESKPFEAATFATYGDKAYFTRYDGSVNIYNLKTEQIEKTGFVNDGTVITSPYSIAVDPKTGRVFVTDAKNYTSNGEVFCFDTAGNKLYSVQAGINPNKVVFK